MNQIPPRGFPVEEFEARVDRAQAAMHHHEMDALVLSMPQNFRYFSGFDSQFWESPTRPFFLIVPAAGEPIAVVPAIGGPGMETTWVKDIRTWPAPCPQDDGVSLLDTTLGNLPRRFGRIGWEMGRESIIRMPIIDFDRLRQRMTTVEFVDGSPLIWELRMVKSALEITKVREACKTPAAPTCRAVARTYFTPLGLQLVRCRRYARLE